MKEIKKENDENKDMNKMKYKKTYVIPIKNMCVFPGELVHFDIKREKSIAALESALKEDGMLFLAIQKNPDFENPTQRSLMEVGTYSEVKQIIKLPNGIIRVVVVGRARAKLQTWMEKETAFCGKIEIVGPWIDDDESAYGCEAQEGHCNEHKNVKQESDFGEHESATKHIEKLRKKEQIVDEWTKELGYNPFEKNAETIPRDEAEIEAEKEILIEEFEKYSVIFHKNNIGFIKHLSTVSNYSRMQDEISVHFQAPFLDQIAILQTVDTQARFDLLLNLLRHAMVSYEIKTDIERKVNEKINKKQREYVLHEQINLLKQELGEESSESEADRFLRELSNVQCSEEIKSKINKEIKHYKSLNVASGESAVERNYIETLLSLPWDKMSEDNQDIREAERILKEDHYGLLDVKERILEYLSVRLLAQKNKEQGITEGIPTVKKSVVKVDASETLVENNQKQDLISVPILCLVGPPGTGKTSIAKSMARSMHKEYVRICLGGVKDEAEIRGHRKTYIGAMPGRIVKALKDAKVKNPLILLDEIDKMSSDYKGDPGSALLEVLDSAQNSKFIDHYVELPIDLSKAVFVATANDVDGIDAPLRDRMEIIDISGYTENEKLHIAKDYLVKKQRIANGLTKKQISFSDKALQKIILCYTREAGVRQLERTIGKVCRKVAKEILEESSKNVKVSAKNLQNYLGKEKFELEKKNKTDDVGIVRGLAWTSVGGVTLEVEVNTMPGKGEIKLTGQLGDVMKESAITAVSFVRSMSETYDIDPEYFDKHDIHLHIPEGAVPKDGPSAGITMATAILSAITGKKVKANLAMTGEITLRGRILAIGGLKEKMLAAKRAGITNLIIPKENEKTLSEIDEEIKSGLNINTVSHMEEVLRLALVD